MAKVLKITRPNKTVHVIPMTNLAFYKGFNQRMPAAEQVKIDIINEKDAEDLDYIDENHVTGVEAIEKLSEKDKEIAKLKALLAEKDALIQVSAEKVTKNTVAPNMSNADKADKDLGNNKPKQTAEEVISLINAATLIADVETLSAGDERKTVQDAAAKKIEALKAS